MLLEYGHSIRVQDFRRQGASSYRAVSGVVGSDYSSVVGRLIPGLGGSDEARNGRQGLGELHGECFVFFNRRSKRE